MRVPQIDEKDVARALPNIGDIRYMTQGGQKVVFSCQIGTGSYVLKFLLAGLPTGDDEESAIEPSIPALDAVTARARREVDTMAKCDVPTLVKLGPVGLTAIKINGQPLLYFTEEKIEGKDLKNILKEQRTLSVSDVVDLGCDIAKAIECIWGLRRIHRDVKPSNIMRRDDTGSFVLLDVGLVFDLQDISLTAKYIVVGTPLYFSPEQMEYARKRQLDFRSDLFALGIVLYESVTGQHPFDVNCTSTTEVLANIISATPTRPRVLRPDVPEELEEVILRLLQKSPHLRYRSCGQLIQHLEKLRDSGNRGSP